LRTNSPGYEKQLGKTIKKGSRGKGVVSEMDVRLTDGVDRRRGK